MEAGDAASRVSTQHKVKLRLLRSPISRALLLAGVCLLAITPFFWWGNPSGHDFEFHMFSWMEVRGQWEHGIVYPRWAALAYWGYGEARFLFYPPASWILGAALGAALPWKVVPGAYCWVVLALAAASMYRLAREWLPAPDALFAAAFYALNPYHLLIVYWRSAYAELLAAALLPLVLLCLLRIFSPESDPGFRPALWLTLTLAAAWLTNGPAAIMIHYSVAGLAAVLAVLERSWRPLLRTALAIALGAGLASFYLIPAVYEMRWVNIGEVLSPGVRPQDNFLFTTIADPDHNRFNLLVSTVALAEIGVLALAICVSRRWWTKRAETGAGHSPWMLLSAWGAASAVLMFSVSNPLWQHLPKFRFVQLPFRWLLCMNAALAMLLTMAARRWRWRWLASGVLLAAVIVAGYRIQPPWWDRASDIREMSDALADGTGYEGTDEYVPSGADAYEVNKSLPLVSAGAGEAVPSEMLAWGPTEKHFVVHASKPGSLQLRLFNYPAWQVTVNGQPAPAHGAEVTGQMSIPIVKGTNDVRIHFRRTIDRTIGDGISWVSLILLGAAWSKTRPQRTIVKSHLHSRPVSDPGASA